MDDMPRGFKGVWIPKDIWLSEELSLIEKCLLVEIDSLDRGEDHCYAGNDHFTKFLGCSEDTISRALKKLEKMHYVIVKRKVTQSGTVRSVRVAPSAKCGSRPPQNAGLLVIQEESNTNTEDEPYGREEEPKAKQKSLSLDASPSSLKTHTTPHTTPHTTSAEKPEKDQEVKLIENLYFEHYKKLFIHKKLAMEKPVYDWGRSRKLIAMRIKQVGAEKLMTALSNGARDPWILEGGFVLSTMLSAGMMTKLLNGKHKAEVEDKEEPEEEWWRKDVGKKK